MSSQQYTFYYKQQFFIDATERRLCSHKDFFYIAITACLFKESQTLATADYPFMAKIDSVFFYAPL